MSGRTTPGYAYPGYPGGSLDDEVAAFLGKIVAASADDAKPLSAMTPGEVRKSCDIREWTANRDAVERKTDVEIDGPGGALPLRIYTPRGEGPFPVLAYFHGGGWVFGSLDEADHLCSALARRTPCVVVSVGYRLSPESKFPAALEDIRAAISWIGGGIGEYLGDPARIALAGESAGANMATSACRMLRDGGGPRIAYQLLICPWTDLSSFERESCALFGDGPWLPRRNLEYYRAQYLGDPAQAFDPRVSPLLAENLRGLPPAHVVTAEFDVLRDDGEAYARRLAEEGTPATMKRYRGMIHSFIALNAVFSKAEEAIDDCAAKLRERLR
jgi:acetyl esterase